MKTKNTLILIGLTAVLTMFMTRTLIQQSPAQPPHSVQVSPTLSDTLDTNNIDRATQLITKISDGKISIIEHFNAGGSLLGFVVQEKNKTEPAGIVYTDSTGTMLISAVSILNQDGQNILDRDFSHYIQPEQALHAYKTIHQTAFLEQGKPEAEHKMYIMIDPNCPHCHTAYVNLQDKIQSGFLAVRWIVVGNITSTSQAKALAILDAENPLEALNFNETHFDIKGHSGGIAPSETPSLLATSKLKNNMDFVMMNKLAYTPTFFFKTSGGLLKLIPGALAGEQLENAIQSASNQF